MIALLLAAAVTPPPAGLAVVRIEHAAARVVVIPEARGGVAVAVRQARGVPPLSIRREGSAVVVDGGVAAAGRVGGFDLLDRARCRARPETLPVITVRTPLNARIVASGALFAEVGPSETLELTAAGCGAWRLGPARRRLSIETRGAPSVRAAGVQGPLHIGLAGSGDVVVEAGHAPTAAIRIRGSGDVWDRGSIGRLQAELKGSGKLRVGEIYGEVDASVNGSGDVLYGRPRRGHFCGGFQKSC